MERVNYIPNEAFGISDEQAREWEEKQSKGHWDHFTPEFVGTQVQTFDINKASEHLDNARVLYQEGRISQPEGSITFQNDLPITIFFIGDVHYGSVFCDHQTFYKHLKEISDTPNAFMVWMANEIDNAIPSQFPSNMLVNELHPDKQVLAMRKICEEMNERGKVLGAVTSPCHSGWTHSHTGQDINALIHGFEGRKYPVLENGGRLNLHFPDWQRTVGVYHMVGPFESNFSPTHATKQMNRLRQNMECDIVAAAHKHVGDAETVYQGNGDHRKTVCYIRSGSYKGTEELHDQWSIGKFGATGDPGGESVTILPKEKLMVANLSFEMGILAQQAYLAHHFA